MYRINYFLLLSGLLLCEASRAADQPPGLSGVVGGGISYEQRDPTASRYGLRPIPYFDVTWNSVELSSDDGLQWSALKGHGFSAGPFVNYVPGRAANGPLRGLGDVHDMLDVGGFVEYSPEDFWNVFAELGRAVGAGSDQGGAMGKFGGELDYPLGAGIFGGTTLAFHYADRRMQQTFFGVDAEQSANSGIDQYRSKGGFQDFTLSEGAEFPIAPHWTLVASANWTHLLGNAADSSIVKSQGHVDQGQVQTAIGYHF